MNARRNAAIGLFLLVCAATPAARAASLPPTTASSDGAWSQIVLPVPPPATEAAGSAYDPVRKRMLLFGGFGPGGAKQTLWSLNFTGVPQWLAVATSGAPPAARLAHTMVYDTARDRMLVFGGTPDGATFDGDVWALALSGVPTWSQLVTAGAGPALFGHSAVYDPVRDRMLVFGGKSGSGYSGDTWQLSLAGTPTWSVVAPAGTGPFARVFTSAIYDPVGDRLLVFGGFCDEGGGNFAATNDTWSLSLAGAPAWTSLAAAGAPPTTRQLHGAVYDAVQGRMVVYGGSDGVNVRNTIYALTLGASPTWSNITPAGGQPVARSSFAFVFDPDGDRAFVFGGLQGSTFLGDTWGLNLGAVPAWSAYSTTASGPGNRLLHVACYDSRRHAMDFFGGYDNTQYVSNLWSIDLGPSTSQTQLDFSSALRPFARETPGLVYDAADDKIVMFGGGGTSQLFNETWFFDPNTGQWSLPGLVCCSPPPSKGLASVYDPLRNRMLVFGGWDGTQALNGLWALSLGGAPHWDAIVPAGTPPAPRFACAMVYDAPHDRIVIYGGFDNFNYFNDVWTLNLAGPPVWTKPALSGVGPLRDAMLGVFDSLRERMVVFGGYHNTGFNDTYALNLAAATPAWAPMAPTGTPPTPRDFTAGVYDPVSDRLMFYGGNAMATPSSPLLGVADQWALTWGDIPTPTLLTFADEQTGAGTVRLAWYTPDGPGQRAVAQRSADGISWEMLATLTSDAAGEFVLTDAVAAGGRFAYRLGVGAPGAEQFTDGHWVTIPAGVVFGITSTGANPSRGALVVAFALPSAGPASLDLYDIAGRRLVHRDVSALGAGVHAVDLAGERALGSGVYWVRLAQGARVGQRRVAIVR